MARFARKPLSLVRLSMGLVVLVLAVPPTRACATRPTKSTTPTSSAALTKTPAAEMLVPPSSGSPAATSSSTSTLPPLRPLAELRAEARKALAEKASKAATSSSPSSSSSTSPITSFLNNPTGWLESELKKVTAHHPLVVAPKESKRSLKAQETTPPYSPVPIPEPSTIALFGLLGVTLVLRKRIWA